MSSALLSSRESTISLRSSLLGTAAGLAFAARGAFGAGVLAAATRALEADFLADGVLALERRGVEARTMTSPHGFGKRGIPDENIGIGTRTVNGTYGLDCLRAVRRPARIAVAEAP